MNITTTCGCIRMLRVVAVSTPDKKYCERQLLTPHHYFQWCSSVTERNKLNVIYMSPATKPILLFSWSMTVHFSVCDCDTNYSQQFVSSQPRQWSVSHAKSESDIYSYVCCQVRWFWSCLHVNETNKSKKMELWCKYRHSKCNQSYKVYMQIQI